VGQLHLINSDRGQVEPVAKAGESNGREPHLPGKWNSIDKHMGVCRYQSDGRTDNFLLARQSAASANGAYFPQPAETV